MSNWPGGRGRGRGREEREGGEERGEGEGGRRGKEEREGGKEGRRGEREREEGEGGRRRILRAATVPKLFSAGMSTAALDCCRIDVLSCAMLPDLS